MDKKLAIILLGAPGSGKGTQGEILEKHTGFKRYVMSDLIKSELKVGSEIHEKIKRGELLGDGDIFDVFRRKFKSEKQIIIDGIPRTVDQAYWLYGYLVRHEYEIKLVFFNVDEKKLVKRIAARRYCPKCHRGYNLLTLKPKVDDVCDVDSEKLIQREDDTAKIFKSRLKIFDEVRDIILNVYSGEIIEVNGDQIIDKVSQDLIQKIILR